uniref:FAS1 domain-containing protein n=1 Tax=Oryza meridionalis TaxID=40149 RepID=A0A0E0E0M8_9ORYZ
MARAGSCAGWASSDGLASRLPLPPKLLCPAATDRDDDEEDDDEDTVLLGIVRHIPCAFDSANRFLSSSPAAAVALSDLLLSHRSRGGGFTVFCPGDDAVAAFIPAFRGLTADAKLALLLYHAVAAHYSEESLKAIDGEVNTLAIYGGKSLNLSTSPSRMTTAEPP